MALRSASPRDIETWAREPKTWPDRLLVKAKADLPDPVRWRGGVLIVTDDVGGEVPAWSDGTDWRRFTDRAVIS